jgi:hypothetical protein
MGNLPGNRELHVSYVKLPYSALDRAPAKPCQAQRPTHDHFQTSHVPDFCILDRSSSSRRRKNYFV